MKKFKMQQFFMLQMLLGFCSTFQTKTNLVAAFKDGAASLGVLIKQILALIGPQNQSVIGSGSQKQQAREHLDLETYYIISAAKGYMLKTGNVNLADKLKLSLSSVRKIVDKEIAGRATNWMNLLTPYAAELIPWGVTAQSFQSLQQAIDAYNAQYLIPQNEIKTRESQLDQINKLIKDAMSVCINTMDTSINSYNKLNEKQFIADYKLRRKQKAIPSRHTTLSAMITTELGACFNCTVTIDAFTKNGKTYPAVSGISDFTGMCIIKEFEPGIRTITVSGESIVTKTFPAMEFIRSKTVQQIFVCTPAFNNIPAPLVQKQKVNA